MIYFKPHSCISSTREQDNLMRWQWGLQWHLEPTLGQRVCHKEAFKIMIVIIYRVDGVCDRLGEEVDGHAWCKAKDG